MLNRLFFLFQFTAGMGMKAFEIFLRQFQEFLAVVFQCLAGKGAKGIGQLSTGFLQSFQFFNMVTAFQFQGGIELGIFITQLIDMALQDQIHKEGTNQHGCHEQANEFWVG
jgi:hypothetical protein